MTRRGLSCAWSRCRPVLRRTAPHGRAADGKRPSPARSLAVHLAIVALGRIRRPIVALSSNRSHAPVRGPSGPDLDLRMARDEAVNPRAIPLDAKLGMARSAARWASMSAPPIAGVLHLTTSAVRAAAQLLSRSPNKKNKKKKSKRDRPLPRDEDRAPTHASSRRTFTLTAAAGRPARPPPPQISCRAASSVMLRIAFQRHHTDGLAISLWASGGGCVVGDNIPTPAPTIVVREDHRGEACLSRPRGRRDLGDRVFRATACS